VDSILTNRLRVYAIRAWHAKTWRAALHIGFFLLCLRFQIAAVRSAGSDFGPVLILIAGSLSLGAWNPWAALFAFTAAAPLLNGLSQTGLLNCAFPPSLVFSALWMGIAAKNLLQKRMTHYSSPTLWTIGQPSFFTKAMDDERSGEGSKTPRILVATKPGQLPFSSYFPSLVIDILIAAVLLSLAWQFWRHRGSAELWPVLFNRAVLGYGDPWYFLTSAFLWLQGLFYFGILYARCVGQWAGSVDPKVEVMAVATWVRPVFAVYAVTMAVFFLFQYFFHIPEGWAGEWAGGVFFQAGFQAPYEDISSFGSIAVTVFIFAVATWYAAPWYKLAINILSCACLLVMVVASWSRATWLAGSVFLLLIAVFRLPRFWTTALILILLAAVVVINANANRPSWINQLYLSRLVALARLENPTNKDSGRINLYKKAARMVHQHPMVGHGIGSFYLMSVNYAEPDDPYATKPDFAHNVFLQIAAEEGVPIAALFAGLIAWTLGCGFCTWLRQRAATAKCSADALLILGATLALGAYLQTQMTANSLNVYVSNQFFFWFLMVAILAISEHEREP
jgi:O-antigen ligase